MQAIIKKGYSKGFLLAEEHLVKINDICAKRFKDAGVDQALNFKVYRSDSLVFDADSYQSVLDEENSKRNKIEKLRITSVGERVKLDLSFDKDDGASLDVEAESKDLAYLVFSDIKEYLTTEVLRFRGFRFSKAFSPRSILPFAMLFPVVFSLTLLESPTLNDGEFRLLLESGAIDEKLNYLLETRRRKDSIENLWVMMGALVLFMGASLFFGPGLDRAYPRNVFCWGKEATSYEKLTSVRSKVVWGIAIAFIISVLASLFVTYISSGS